SVNTFGEDDPGIWYAPRSVAGPTEEWNRVPTPPGNLTEFGWMISNERLVVAGGYELGEATNLVHSYQYDRGVDEWREVMYKLPVAPGAARALSVNSVAVVSPVQPEKDEQGEWPLQRVYWAHDRAVAGGTIDQWLSYTYDFPAPTDPFVFAIDD